MAIILNRNNKTRAVISSDTALKEQKGLCRETTIIINKDGSVKTPPTMNPDGTYTEGSILNLGFKGDNLVTIINIDTSNLEWGGLNANNINLKDAYHPMLVFQDVNEPTWIKSVEFEGNYFTVPQEITERNTVYNIVYVLRERLEKSEGGE